VTQLLLVIWQEAGGINMGIKRWWTWDWGREKWKGRVSDILANKRECIEWSLKWWKQQCNVRLMEVTGGNEGVERHLGNQCVENFDCLMGLLEITSDLWLFKHGCI
jgi:hypothetical protein